MAEEQKPGCTRPSGGLAEQQEQVSEPNAAQPTMEVKQMVHVGKPAPDFTLPAYHKGAFTNVNLSEHLGKWVVLCFYPGDFTFV